MTGLGFPVFCAGCEPAFDAHKGGNDGSSGSGERHGWGGGCIGQVGGKLATEEKAGVCGWVSRGFRGVVKGQSKLQTGEEQRG